MKANELMIGDFVTFKDCQNDEEILVIKIWHLSQEGNALVFIDDSKALDEIAIDDEIVGIPLTPEILEKNGFEKFDFMNIKGQHQWSFWIDILTSVSLWCKNLYDNPTEGWMLRLESSLASCCIKIEYAHELQHALRLCGIDKTIEL